MNHFVILLVLSVSAMAYSSNANTCQFGSEVIQAVYDRFEIFKNTKAFDPTDLNIPLEKYQFYADGGEKRLSMTINGVTLTEESKTDDYDRIERIHGQYEGVGVILDYVSDGNGEFSFTNMRNGNQFNSLLGSTEADLPSHLEGDNKKALVDLNALRTKMFDFQQGLSMEGVHRVQSFLLRQIPTGFLAEYIESESLGVLIVDQKSVSDISGRYSCIIEDQYYKIVDGKVITDGEPVMTPISPRI